MKKFGIIIFSILLLCLGGCALPFKGQSSDNVLKDKSESIDNMYLSKETFRNEKTDKVLSENEVRSNLKRYLSYNKDYYKIHQHIKRKLNANRSLTSREKTLLHQANKLALKNDEQFYNYVNYNRLPKAYDGPAQRISDYVSSLNDYYKKENNPYQSRNELSKLKDKYHEMVNKKKQKRIERFLKQKHIELKPFH